MMKTTFSLSMLLILLSTGCMNSSPEPISVWQSDTASIEERFVAAQSLIQSNATLPEIQKILGTPGTWFRENRLVIGPDTEPHRETFGVIYPFGEDSIKIYCSPYDRNESNVVYRNKMRMLTPREIPTDITVEIY